MRKKLSSLIIMVILLVLGTAFVAAEDVERPDEIFPEALGGFYGPFSGSGLHYHRSMGENAFQVSGGIIYVPFDQTDSWINNTLDYSIGAEYQRRVYGEAFTNWIAGSLYLFAGGMHHGYIPIILVAEGYEVSGSDSVEYVDPVYGVGTYQADISVGAGIGIEMILFRHISVPLEFGYGATWTITEPVFADAIAVGPNVQTGLRYRY